MSLQTFFLLGLLINVLNWNGNQKGINAIVELHKGIFSRDTINYNEPDSSIWILEHFCGECSTSQDSCRNYCVNHPLIFSMIPSRFCYRLKCLLRWLNAALLLAVRSDCWFVLHQQPSICREHFEAKESFCLNKQTKLG